MASAEFIVNRWLATQMPDARVVVDTPGDLEGTLGLMPVVQTIGFGGPQDFTLAAQYVVINTYALETPDGTGRGRVRDLADRVHNLLLFRCSGQMPGGSVSRVTCSLTPSEQKYPNDAVVRFTARYLVRVRDTVAA